jgi:hypothetical protein
VTQRVGAKMGTEKNGPGTGEVGPQGHRAGSIGCRGSVRVRVG